MTQGDDACHASLKLVAQDNQEGKKMLAQNFKTAAELGITDVEQAALVKLLGMFERGDIIPGHFDMTHWDSRCGTVHCIGGWARKIAANRSFGRRTGSLQSDGLSRLFYPDCDGGMDATLFQATCALRNYLTTGKPNWEEALAS